MSISITSNVEPTEITIYDQGVRNVFTSKCNYDGLSSVVTNLSALSGESILCR